MCVAIHFANPLKGKSQKMASCCKRNLEVNHTTIIIAVGGVLLEKLFVSGATSILRCKIMIPQHSIYHLVGM